MRQSTPWFPLLATAASITIASQVATAAPPTLAPAVATGPRAWRIPPALTAPAAVAVATTTAEPPAGLPPSLGPTKAPQLVLTDPTGDNFNPAADATTIQAEILGGNITFTLAFATLSVADVYGSLNLDLDQNPSTGAFPPANGSSGQTVGVERELFMDIWNDNGQPQPLVLVLDGPTRNFLFAHAMSIVGTTVSFTIPLSELNNDDGNMNLAMGVVNGTQSLFADLAPDTGHGTVSASADVTRPTVLSVAPTNGSTGVVRDTAVIVTFSEPLAPATVNSTNFNLKQGATPIAGSISLSGGNTVATFTPSALLAASTVFTVTATTGITDVAGNPLNGNGGGGNFTSTFTTGTGVSLPILAADPAGDATGPHDLTALRVGETVSTLTFGLDLAAFNASDAFASINLDTDRNPGTGQSPPLSGSPAHDIGAEYELWLDLKNLNARPQPTAFLLNAADRSFVGPEYPMTLTPTTVRFSVPLANIGEQADGSMDLAMIVWTPSTGQASDFLPASGHVSFITAIDRVPPAVTLVSPANGTQGVAVGTNVVLTFDGALNPATVTSASVFLRNTKTATNVPSTLALSAGNTVVTIDPTAALADSVRHEVHVTTALQDVAGNAAASEFVSDFRTADITRPTVTFALPTAGQTGVVTTTTVVLTFSEAVTAVDRDKFKLLQGTQRVAANYSLTGGGRNAVLTPLLPLVGGTTYTVRGETTILDLNGNALNGNGSGGPYVASFTTAATAPPDTLRATSVSIPTYWTQVTVPVYLRNTFAVGGVSFMVTFDAAELALDSVTSTGRSAGMEFIGANSPTPGTLAVTMLANLAGSSGALVAPGSGAVVNLVFDVIAAPHAATIPLTINSASLAVQSGLAFANPARVAGSVVRNPALAGPPVGLPPPFALSSPAPNPFNPRVAFAVSLPRAERARVAVHDARGALVRVLWDAELPAGSSQLVWDGADGDAKPAASGVYYFRLDAADGTRVRKAVLAR